jgi:hypothetical protein
MCDPLTCLHVSLMHPREREVFTAEMCDKVWGRGRRVSVLRGSAELRVERRGDDVVAVKLGVHRRPGRNTDILNKYHELDVELTVQQATQLVRALNDALRQF